MRTLRYAGPGVDENHVVVETATGEEKFSLLVNADLRAVTRIELPRPAAPSPVGPPAAEPSLAPREIQTRVRSGQTPESIAEESGMAVEKVLRFAAAVLDERARVAAEARRARARRPDGQLVVFGEAVDSRYTAHGLDPLAVTWDAHRREDGQWIVSASWVGGEAQRRADWSFSLATRTLSPLDDAATDLLSDRPIRPVLPAVPPTLTSVPDEPTPEAVTAPLPDQSASSQQLFDQQDEPRYEFEPLPLRLAEPGGMPMPTITRPVSRRTESDEDRAARARIPSWDDILLGVRRKSE